MLILHLAKLIMTSAICLEAFEHEFCLDFVEAFPEISAMWLQSFEPTIVLTVKVAVWLVLESVNSDMCDFMQENCKFDLTTCIALCKMDLLDARIAKPIVFSKLWVNQQGQTIVCTILVDELVYLALSHHIIY